MTKTIEVIVSSKGEATVTTKGFIGARCRDASRSLEEALGQRVSEQLTAEFHQAMELHRTQQQA
jgi:hypothetical protein